MKKITIIFISVLMIFTSCPMDIPYDDIIENAETVEKSKEDDTKNNTEEPSNEEPKEDNSENDNDEEGNSENTETVEKSKEDDTKNNTEEPSNEEDDIENDNDEEGNSENTEIVEESKEDDTEIVEDEPLNEELKEDDSENTKTVEDKTWCEIDEDTKILGLNYFVCVDNSQKKLSPSINDESQAKKDTFLIRGYASRYVEIRVGYNNKKLNFSSVSDSYIITDVMKKDSTININIEWK